MKLLVIDDDKQLTKLLYEYLKKFEYHLLIANDPTTGFKYLKNESIKLIILDVMLPQMNGFEVCKKIRQFSEIPILMLTARGEITDRVVGLELGADDYLPKPFEPRELVARIQSILRRTEKSKNITEGQNKLEFENLIMNIEKREVILNDEILELTVTEFDLLHYFVQNPGKVLSRDELMENIHGFEWESFNRSIDVCVSRLRQKLKEDSKKPQFIKTIWGNGYLFVGKSKSVL